MGLCLLIEPPATALELFLDLGITLGVLAQEQDILGQGLVRVHPALERQSPEPAAFGDVVGQLR